MFERRFKFFEGFLIERSRARAGENGTRRVNVPKLAGHVIRFESHRDEPRIELRDAVAEAADKARRDMAETPVRSARQKPRPDARVRLASLDHLEHLTGHV